MNREDFEREYNRRISESYPEKLWVRCLGGVPQLSAHWSPRPAGQHFELHRSGESDFQSDVTNMTSKGFTAKYDISFQGCYGLKRHVTLWTKPG